LLGRARRSFDQQTPQRAPPQRGGQADELRAADASAEPLVRAVARCPRGAERLPAQLGRARGQIALEVFDRVRELAQVLDHRRTSEPGQLGEQHLAHSIARVPRIAVGRVLAPGESGAREQAADLGAAQREQRPHDADASLSVPAFAVRFESRQPGEFRTADPAHQECLETVVGVVRGQDDADVRAPCFFEQDRIARAPGALLQRRCARVELDAPQPERNFQRPAELRAELRVRVGLRAAQAVVDVHGDQRRPLERGAQPVEEQHAVRAAREREHERLARLELHGARQVRPARAPSLGIGRNSERGGHLGRVASFGAAG
jgi:hypothetical protein